MATEKFSTKFPMFIAKVSEVMQGNQLIFMQSFLTFCHRQIRSISCCYHISSALYIGLELAR